MHDYIISCCSPADLSHEKLDSLDVRRIYSDYTMDGVPFKDDLGKTMSSQEFYDRIRAGEVGVTSLVNTATFVEYFTNLFETENKDILHVTLSSGLSGTFQAALAAADIMKEKFPERKLLIVDSRGASSGYGFLVQALCDLRDEGKSIDELFDWALKNRLHVQHLFCSTTLTYYVRGGRISAAAGRIGNLLGICPVTLPSIRACAPRSARSVRWSTRWRSLRTAARTIPAASLSAIRTVSTTRCRSSIRLRSASRTSRVRSRSTTSARSSAATPVPAPWRCSSSAPSDKNLQVRKKRGC